MAEAVDILMRLAAAGFLGACIGFERRSSQSDRHCVGKWFSSGCHGLLVEARAMRKANAIARKRSADRLGRASVSLAMFYAPLTVREMARDAMHDYVRSILRGPPYRPASITLRKIPNKMLLHSVGVAGSAGGRFAIALPPFEPRRSGRVDKVR